MNKITVEFLQFEIVGVEYTRLQGTLTHCAITVKNGFTFTGESSCVDPANFDEEIGKQIAYENAFEKMWMPYGFWLKQKIGGDFAFRLRNERDELAERFDKLEAYLSTAKFGELDNQNQELLREQHQAMKPYLAVLNARVALL